MSMQHVAIIGLGLMGGSLGLALKRRGDVVVQAYARRVETRRAARAAGAADGVHAQAAAAVDGADIVVLCVPVLAAAPLTETFRGALKRGAIVTDVGSTKRQVMAALGEVLRGTGAVCVGSHPLAGSERTGLDAASAALYTDATVVVVPDDASPPAAVAAVSALWESVGARVKRMSAAEHDRVLARTSHLPHIAAAALVETVLGGDADDAAPLCGSGFWDTTRIAAGDAGMWHDIVASNRDETTAALAAYERTLAGLRADIAGGRFEAVRDFLAAAQRKRGANR
jgi:cyclohexadieny/prephenate dehydrogenase